MLATRSARGTLCLRRRLFSTAASKQALAIDEMLEPPVHLAVDDQLVRLAKDDELRGRKQFPLPDELFEVAQRPAFDTWGTYFVNRGFDGPPVLDRSDRLLLQSLTAAFSCPLTMFTAIRAIGLDQAADSVSSHGEQQQLRIHVLGASSQEETLLPYYWYELADLLPEHELHLTLVGPEVTMPEGGRKRAAQVGPRMHATFSCQLYHEYLASEAAEAAAASMYAAAGVDASFGGGGGGGGGGSAGGPDTADLIVAFNPGVGTDPLMWRETLAAVIDSGRPFLCTSFGDADNEKDQVALQRAGARLVRDSERNPFASMLSERSGAGDGRAIIRSNAWWRVVQGRAADER
jgi:hypothetical protein